MILRKLLILISIIFMMACENSATPTDSNDTTDTTDISNRALLYSPYAPEIVSGSNTSSGSEIRNIVNSDEQNFLMFTMIQASASNYDSMIDITVPIAMQILETSEPQETDLYPFTVRRTSEDYKYFKNEDESITATISITEGEFRQFDAFMIPNDEYKYSRCYFYWPGNPGVDITEVWEYSDRKEVSVTMYNGDLSNVDKYLAVTNTSDEFQMTSLMFGSFDYENDTDFTMEEYSNLGFIDFSMTSADQVTYDAVYRNDEDSYLPEGSLSFSYLVDLHNKSVSMTEAKAVIFDTDNPEPYTVFFE